jgi:hypothetical protein
VVQKPLLDGLARRIVEIRLCGGLVLGALPLGGRGARLQRPRPGLERPLGREDLLLPLQHAFVGIGLGLRALVLGRELGRRQALGLGVLVLDWSLRGPGMIGLRVGLISRRVGEGVMRLGVELDRGGAVDLWAGGEWRCG